MGSGVLQGAPKDAPDIVRVPDRQREMKVSHLGATSREGCLRTLGVCLAEKLSHGGLRAVLFYLEDLASLALGRSRGQN